MSIDRFNSKLLCSTTIGRQRQEILEEIPDGTKGEEASARSELDTELQAKSRETARERTVAVLRLVLHLVSHQSRLVKALAPWIPRLSGLLDRDGTEQDLDALMREMTGTADMPARVAKALIAKRNGN